MPLMPCRSSPLAFGHAAAKYFRYAMARCRLRYTRGGGDECREYDVYRQNNGRQWSAERRLLRLTPLLLHANIVLLLLMFAAAMPRRYAAAIARHDASEKIFIAATQRSANARICAQRARRQRDERALPLFRRTIADAADAADYAYADMPICC